MIKSLEMIKCLECGKDFKMITNSHLKVHELTTEEYLSKYPESSLYDDEMLVKISETRYSANRPKCKKPGCSNIVTQSWNKYCTRACSMSDRMSKNGRAEQAGERNPSWTDGTYSTEKSQKKKARERDNYICQSCNKKVRGRAAHVHHMIPERCFDDLNEAHDLSNLVTLCDTCHQQIEWKVLKEAHNRAYKLDKLLENDTSHTPFEVFKANLLNKKE